PRLVSPAREAQHIRGLLDRRQCRDRESVEEPHVHVFDDVIEHAGSSHPLYDDWIGIAGDHDHRLRGETSPNMAHSFQGSRSRIHSAAYYRQTWIVGASSLVAVGELTGPALFADYPLPLSTFTTAPAA
ncbi:MAG: hypothetical protein GY722_27865, partial [bacterium]|nr:hypothetical protein [bacterium]